MNEPKIRNALRQIEESIENHKENIKETVNNPGRKTMLENSLKNLEVTKEACEKQIPKKAIKTGNMCPVCHSYLASEPIGDKYCFSCGQAIGWENENETNII